MPSMMEAWLSSSDSTASSGPSRTWRKSTTTFFFSLHFADIFWLGFLGFLLVTAEREEEPPQTGQRWRRSSWHTGCSLPSGETRPASAPDFCECPAMEWVTWMPLSPDGLQCIHHVHHLARVFTSMKSHRYLSAADKPDRAQSSTVWMESINACLHNLWMTGQSQVVVGAEVQYACNRDREAHVKG